MTAPVSTAPRGLTRDGLDAVEALAREHVDRGWHSAAQLAVYRDGRPQLDLRLGDAARPDARLLWFSATKPLTAVAILILAERGLLDLDRPIAEIWPEFARGGKATVTTQQVLTHRGGFPVLPRDFDWSRIDDWAAVCEATASLEAQWEPGTVVGYHPVTFGLALGEVIRRVDGRMPRDFLREEIFEPLGMDASLGLEDARHGEVVLPEALSEVTWQDPEGTEGRTSDIVRRFRMPSTLRGQLPSANAIGPAEALARFYAMLERGGSIEIDGREVRILRPETVRDATRVHAAVDADFVSGMPSSFGLGFMVGGPLDPWCDTALFGHTGQQCTVSFADRERGLAVAYVTNGLHDPLVVQERTQQLVAALRRACALADGDAP